MGFPSYVIFLILSIVSTCTFSDHLESSFKFSKLLNEKPELLKFTSLANTRTPPPRFQNVYNRAEDVVPISQHHHHHEIGANERGGHTQNEPIGKQDDFSHRLHKEGEEDVDGILTKINQKPLSGRREVTALRQSSGRKLNISPVFIGSSNDEKNEKIESVTSYPVTSSPNNETDEEEESEVTTVSNLDLAREPLTKNRVTVFDNRTSVTTPKSISSSTTEEEGDNLVADSFHRHGHFPDFEDLGTNLAGAESSQPARVNVRPASSGKDYEYEYIYYYYDDEDEDNSTSTPKESDGGKLQTGKISEPSNSLSTRDQKSVDKASPPSSSNTLNAPIVLKQSSLEVSKPKEYTGTYPQVPRSNPAQISTTPFTQQPTQKTTFRTTPYTTPYTTTTITTTTTTSTTTEEPEVIVPVRNKFRGQQSNSAPSRNEANSFAPSRNEPNSFAPTRNEPSSFAPTRNEPNSFAPTRNEPSSFAPTRNEPNSFAPTRNEPSSFAPTRNEPSSFAPTRNEPNSFAPTRNEPNSFAPTRNEPNSFSSSRNEANSFAPTRNEPNSFAPTRNEPSSFAPTRNEPNSFAPSRNEANNAPTSSRNEFNNARAPTPSRNELSNNLPKSSRNEFSNAPTSSRNEFSNNFPKSSRNEFNNAQKSPQNEFNNGPSSNEFDNFGPSASSGDDEYEEFEPIKNDLTNFVPTTVPPPVRTTIPTVPTTEKSYEEPPRQRFRQRQPVEVANNGFSSPAESKFMPSPQEGDEGTSFEPSKRPQFLENPPTQRRPLTRRPPPPPPPAPVEEPQGPKIETTNTIPAVLAPVENPRPRLRFPSRSSTTSTTTSTNSPISTIEPKFVPKTEPKFVSKTEPKFVAKTEPEIESPISEVPPPAVLPVDKLRERKRGGEKIIKEKETEEEREGEKTQVKDNSKENFARQKSINDLYALSRLHQLAINNRVPNKKTEGSPLFKGTPPKNSGGFISSAEATTVQPEEIGQSSETSTVPPSSIVSSGDFQRLSTSTTEEIGQNIVSSTERGRVSKFRGRNRATESSVTSTTTSAPTQRNPSSNRFAGRRRNPSQVQQSPQVSTNAESVAPQQNDNKNEAEPVSQRAPVRNRFAGRTRPTASTTTTESSESVGESDRRVPAGNGPIRRRPPGFTGARRRGPSTPAPNAENSPPASDSSPVEPSAQPPSQSPPVENEPIRRVPGGVRGGRIRGGGGTSGVAPIVGRPLRGRTTTPPPPPPVEEVQEPIREEEGGANENRGGGVGGANENRGEGGVRVEEGGESKKEEEPIVTQKVSVSSSTTTLETVEAPKRGSAGVLGRLRSRGSRPNNANNIPVPNASNIANVREVSTPPPPPPEQQSSERKESRLNGILNRRKQASSSTTISPATPEPQLEGEEEERGSQHNSESVIPPDGVIVAVSSVVSETEEGGEDDMSSSTTQGSILNRLKSQRKPGSIFRKRQES